MQHVARGSVTSPYISLTRSFGVARSYAIVGRALASPSTPGFVYEIEIEKPTVSQLIDPVKAVAEKLPPSYHHDGAQEFLHGVIDPVGHLKQLQAHILQPPGTSSTPRPANLSIELETIVRALRDAEILMQGNLPASLVRNQFPVW
jgi:hypothetical protein